MEKRIIIDVDPSGEVRIETEGYQGPRCLQATKELKAKLGTVIDTQEKPEIDLLETQEELKLEIKQ